MTTLYTIGHSTRSFEEFVELLHANGVEVLADIRSYPGSRKYPHFNKENLEEEVPRNDISYIHLKSLGGRRKASPDSENEAWRHPAFRGYADYMATSDFKKGIETLEQTAAANCTAIMCSEAVWWRCHRSMVADYLKAKGWQVLHIMDKAHAVEHPFTAPARVVDGRLTYKTEGNM